MSKKMKKRQFKKNVGIVHEQYYAFADQLPTFEEKEKAYKWLEDLVAKNQGRPPIKFSVLYDKMDEMYNTIIVANNPKEN